MNNIIEPNKNFDFSKLSLSHPSGIQGGAYFTKILYNNKPLYIQTTKSLTRQGFVKSGKKYYCDLMLDNNSEILIQWFENLEETCQKLIFEKSEAWFQNSLDKNDVESAFNSVIRIYKSGKYYLVRTNIRVGPDGEPYIKIYNENENPLSINDVKEDTNIISILEIQGIKFTSRNFQIDIELRQAMVLDNEPLFENCLIKSINNKNTNFSQIQREDKNENVNNETLEKPLEEDINMNNENDKINIPNISNTDNIINDENNDECINIENHLFNKQIEENENNGDNSDINILDIEDLNESEKLDELKEIDIAVNLENTDNETLILKKPNQVYYDLYKEARDKAKLAKRMAIIAYLEAKNIKKTYMIDTLDENDTDDIDAEIDEVSESELDEF
jgi:hypothetical protein